jgi:hypothetical protein
MRAGMKFMRTAGYTHFGYVRNKDIMKQLNTKSIMEFGENYKAKWENHVL